MGYLALAFSSAILYGFWAFSLSTYRGRLSNWIIILLSASAAGVMYALLGAISGTLIFDSDDVIPGLIGGVLRVGGTYCLLMAYQRGKVAIASGVAATSVLVPLSYSIYIGEPLTAITVAGVILMLAGLAAFYLAGLRGGPGSAPSDTRAHISILFALGAALLWGTSVVVVDEGTRVSVTGTNLVAQIPQVTITVIMVLLTARSQFRTMPSKAYAVLLSAGIFLALANVAFYTAANEGNIGVVSVIGSLDPLVTAILAAFFFKERLRRSEVFAFAVVLVGACVVVI